MKNIGKINKKRLKDPRVKEIWKISYTNENNEYKRNSSAPAGILTVTCVKHPSHRHLLGDLRT